MIPSSDLWQPAKTTWGGGGGSTGRAGAYTILERRIDYLTESTILERLGYFTQNHCTANKPGAVV